MKSTIRITVSAARQPALMQELITLCPKGAYKNGAGQLTAFIIAGAVDGPDQKRVVEYLKAKGYNLTLTAQDYTKEVSALIEYVYEREDCENAKYLAFYSSKESDDRSYGYIRKERAKLIKLPPKFRYCCQQDVFLITPSVRAKLEAEHFKGIVFLPVDHVPTAVGNVAEDYDRSEGSKQIHNLAALYSTVSLPFPVAYSKGIEVFDGKQIKALEPFDVAISSQPSNFNSLSKVHSLYCSNRFYRFWVNNFGDVEWTPIKIKND